MPRAHGSDPTVTGPNLPDDEHDHQRRPLGVAHRWAERLAAGDLDGAMLSYAPDAALHVDGDVAIGPADIRHRWGSSPLLGGPVPTSIHGEEGMVVVWWEAAPPEDRPVESRLRIIHGEIADQRHGVGLLTAPVATAPPPIRVEALGPISVADQRHAVTGSAGRSVSSTPLPWSRPSGSNGPPTPGGGDRPSSRSPWTWMVPWCAPTSPPTTWWGCGARGPSASPPPLPPGRPASLLQSAGRSWS